MSIKQMPICLTNWHRAPAVSWPPGSGYLPSRGEGNIPPAAEWIPTHAVCLPMLSDSLPPACSVHVTEAMWDKPRFVAKKKSRCERVQK